MKDVKMLGLLAVAAAALMALAGTASATVLTSPEGTTYTGSIDATSTNTNFHHSFITVSCSHSAAKGSVLSHGGAQVHVSLSSLTFTGCNYPTTVKSAGSLTIDSTNVLRSTGAEISIHTSYGICTLTTNSTPVGTITEGKGATWDIASAKIPRTGGNFLCGSSWTWTGSYDFTTPNDLWVD